MKLLVVQRIFWDSIICALNTTLIVTTNMGIVKVPGYSFLFQVPPCEERRKLGLFSPPYVITHKLLPQSLYYCYGGVLNNLGFAQGVSSVKKATVYLKTLAVIGSHKDIAQ